MFNRQRSIYNMDSSQSPSLMLASTSLKINAAKARLKRSHRVNKLKQTFRSLWEMMFRVHVEPDNPTASNDEYGNNEEGRRNSNQVVQQLRAITWPEITSLVRTGLSGYWSLAIFLVVGHAAAHITGPSIVVSVVIAAFTSMLSGN